MGRPHQPFFSQKTRLNDLSYNVKIWTDFYFLLSQSTRLTDGQRILIARPRLHSMQRGKNLKLVHADFIVLMKCLLHRF